MNNVLILTSGLSGSSVLSNLISQAGYWVGDETKKKEYDTHENGDLVELNKYLLESVGYKGLYTREFDSVAISNMKRLTETVDSTRFVEFIDYCNSHSPWIWKDPRLWVTFDFWAPLLNKNDIKVIFLDRGLMQRWISVNLRRQIQSYDYCRSYTSNVNSTIQRIIQEHQLMHFGLNFDDLLTKPEDTLDQLNQFLGTELNMDDLRRVYNKELYKKARGLLDFVKASLIYVKNYNEQMK